MKTNKAPRTLTIIARDYITAPGSTNVDKFTAYIAGYGFALEFVTRQERNAHVEGLVTHYSKHGAIVEIDFASEIEASR